MIRNTPKAFAVFSSIQHIGELDTKTEGDLLEKYFDSLDLIKIVNVPYRASSGADII
jgi:hypothetical protein